jgi:Xaa-Pro aminopeptidase
MMADTCTLPKDQYFVRIREMQKRVQESDLHAVIAVSTEAEPANVRYFSNYWPVFETAGILIPRVGEALLLIGPETGTIAEDHSVVSSYRKLVEFRESSDPEYPEVDRTTFSDVFSEVNEGDPISRLGLIGTNIMSVQVYEGITEALPGAEIVKADDLLRSMRMRKTDDELALMREAARIAIKGFDYAIERIKPGMTEIQATAECLYGVLSNGAEAPGFMIWCISGKGTNQAIGKARQRKIEKNDIVQVTMGAMVDGYVASLSRVVVFGEMRPAVRRMLEVGLEANRRTHEAIKAGAEAAYVAKQAQDHIKACGMGDYIVYGPAHGTGMAECEYPFIESNSEFQLQERMTFSVDTFLAGADFGMRYEDPIVVTTDGEEQFAPHRREIINL